MKKKKLTKLLPAALALMLMSTAAYAVPSDEATSTLQITVPEFINITKDGSSTETTSATFDDNYSTITLSPSLNAIFNVINNQPGREIYLSATAPTSGGSTTALYGDDADNMKIVFTNNSRQPADTSVTNITSGSGTAYKGNPDAIAFAISPTITPDTESGAEEPQKEFNSNKAKYTIKNGKYKMQYTIGTTAEANTFSTHDTDGTYQATMTLTTTGP